MLVSWAPLVLGPVPVAEEVYHGDLVALEDVGVERDPLGYGPDPLEEIVILNIRAKAVYAV
jgi:hypothetical protein